MEHRRYQFRRNVLVVGFRLIYFLNDLIVLLISLSLRQMIFSC